MATYKIIVNNAGCFEDVLTIDTNLPEQTVAGIFDRFVKDVIEYAIAYDFDDPIITLDDIQRVTANGRLYWYEMDSFLIDIYKTN